MRNGFLALVVLALAACGDYQRSDLTGPSKPAAAVVAPLTDVDTARASSICRASFRTRQAARLQLSTIPGDSLIQKKARTFGALVTTVCR